MGATTWICHTEYTEDVSAALRQLQEQVFRSRGFRKPRANGPSNEEVERRLRQIESNFERERQALLDAKGQMQALVDTGQVMYDVPTFVAEDLTPERLKRRYLELVEKMRQQPVRKFRSIKGLRKACGADGTHSILDIRTISVKVKAFAASPLSERELQQLFGTVHPSGADVEGRIGEVAELRERWSAAYVFAYEQGEPVSIYFIGATGD